MRCLECGNKAKKDCLYYRCRSCCKRHGFHCQTHVKSTWAPISTRQVVMNSEAAMAPPSVFAPPQVYHRQQEERQQLLLSSASPSSSGFGGHFPVAVSGEATFTCVRVTTSTEENAYVDQYAYETSINVGGHVFRGILYDQGPNNPIMSSTYSNVDERGQHNSAINISSNLQPVTNLRSTLSTPNYPL